MGSKITPQTPVGRQAADLRPRAQRMLRRIASNPPEGVIPGIRGGRKYLSPLGYFGHRLYLYALRNMENGGMKSPWRDANAATAYLRTFLRGGNGRIKQNDLLHACLLELEREFPRIEKHVAAITVIPPRADPGIEVGGTTHKPPQAVSEPPVAAEGVPEDVRALGRVVAELEAMEPHSRDATISCINARYRA